MLQLYLNFYKFILDASEEDHLEKMMFCANPNKPVQNQEINLYVLQLCILNTL